MTGDLSKPLRDPKAKKAKDNARQRKIASNSSDKAARRNAPRIKAMENRKIRRSDRMTLAGAEIEESADQINLKHRHKDRHWGSDNAAAHRAMRDAERAFLDDTAGSAPTGRRRAMDFLRALRIEKWLK